MASSLEVDLTNLVNFLHEYSWLHRVQNSHLLVNDLFTKIPQEWLSYFETVDSIEALGSLILGDVGENTPTSLKYFCQQVKELKPEYHICKYTPIQIKNTKHLNSKKKYEIAKLGSLIHEKCKNKDIAFLIDIGSGLGHLSQLLFQTYNYKILGIEANAKFVEQAKKNQDKEYPNSIGYIKYANYTVTGEFGNYLESLLLDNFSSFNPLEDKICVIALHACADLTIHILNVHNKLCFVSSLIVMSCCYHRMDGSDNEFTNFPLSKYLKNKCKNLGSSLLSRSFLRLACQRSSTMWSNEEKKRHDIQAFNLLYRNILQKVAHQGNYTIHRLKRKCGNANSANTINDFFQRVHSVYKITNTVSNQDISKNEYDILCNQMNNIYLELTGNGLNFIYLFIALQATIQPLCENLIILDRYTYLQELNISAHVEKVFDDAISSRCYAFILNK